MKLDKHMEGEQDTMSLNYAGETINFMQCKLLQRVQDWNIYPLRRSFIATRPLNKKWGHNPYK